MIEINKLNSSQVLCNFLFAISYNQEKTLAIFSTCKNNQHVALTFDDGPDAGFTDSILDILKEKKAKATFFVSGKQIGISKNVEILKRAYKEGHDIASHGWSHTSMLELSDKETALEMKNTSDEIFKAIGERDALVRPPFGYIDDRVRCLLNALDYEIVGWDIDTNDWKETPENVVLSVENSFKKNPLRPAIILMHDLTQRKFNVIPKIIEILISNQSKIVTITECLKRDSPFFQNYKEMITNFAPNNCVQFKQRKTNLDTRFLFLIYFIMILFYLVYLFQHHGLRHLNFVFLKSKK